jgi:hypothetical protein
MKGMLRLGLLAGVALGVSACSSFDTRLSSAGDCPSLQGLQTTLYADWQESLRDYRETEEDYAQNWPLYEMNDGGSAVENRVFIAHVQAKIAVEGYEKQEAALREKAKGLRCALVPKPPFETVEQIKKKAWSD